MSLGEEGRHVGTALNLAPVLTDDVRNLALPDILFVHAPDGRFLECHARHPDEMLVPADRLLGRPLSDVVSERVAELGQAAITAVLESGAEQTFSYSLERPGGLRHYESRMVQCGPERVLSIVRDVTDLVKARAWGRRQTVQLDAIMDTVPAPVFIRDVEGRYTRFNRAAREFLGARTAAALLDAPGAALWPDEDVALWAGRDEVLRKGEGSTHETLLGGAEGTLRTVVYSQAPLLDSEGGFAGSVGALFDVTDLKHAQVARERANVFLQNVINALPEVLLVYNPDYTIALSNQTDASCTPLSACYERLNCGYDCGQGAPAAGCPVRQVFESGQPISVEQLQVGRDGQPLPVELVAAPLLGEDGAVRQVVATVRSIAARKEAERRREVAEAGLRQSRKMEAIGQLAGGVAHDFNNLLQVIQGYTDLAVQSLPEGGTKADLEEVLGAAQRASDLTQQLLAFSRQQMLQRVDLDLNTLVTNLLKMLGRLIGTHIQVVFSPASCVLPVLVDRSQLEQVIINLSINARDAMPEGGQLSIETRLVNFDADRALLEDLEAAGTYVALRVTDTGVGMSETAQQRVFDPFYTTKALGKGTGLGLATTHGVIKQHGGSVRVRSAVGRGTTFCVYLPVSVPAGLRAQTPALPQVAGEAETVLVVEDDTNVRRLALAFLKRGGYRVLSASDGREALEVFEVRGAEIDLVLLDIVMPRLGGRETYERLRVSWPDVPVLFASGYRAGGVHTRFVAEQGLELLQKPFSRWALLQRVHALLR